MKRTTQLLALCSAMPIAFGDDGGVPEWLHLLPAASEVRTVDGRGPYIITSLQSIVDAFKPGDKLVLDENHSTDLAAPQGRAAPARGWIVALQAREDGIWGQVEWTGEGRRLMEDKAYRGLSPAILHDRDLKVLGLARASLTNKPNLVGLVALHSETDDMDWKARLLEVLGLGSDADDAAIEAAISAKMKSTDKPETALQAVLEHPSFVSLQTELATAQGQIKDLTEGNTRRAAELFVDASIAEGRAGLNATVRDEYIALHMANPEQAKRLVTAMPMVSGTTRAGGVPPVADADGLTDAHHSVIALMGLDPEQYKESLAASGKKEETL